MDNGLDGGVTAEQVYNLRQEKGNAKYTPRIQFVSNLVWQLPIGKGGYLLNNDSALTKIVGGWKLSAAYLAESGDFLTPPLMD